MKPSFHNQSDPTCLRESFPPPKVSCPVEINAGEPGEVLNITFVKCSKHGTELPVIKEEAVSKNVVALSVMPCLACLLEERKKCMDIVIKHERELKWTARTVNNT